MAFNFKCVTEPSSDVPGGKVLHLMWPGFGLVTACEKTITGRGSWYIKGGGAWNIGDHVRCAQCSEAFRRCLAAVGVSVEPDEDVPHLGGHSVMTNSGEHAARHEFLHGAVDELLADYMVHVGSASPRSPVIGLLEWSNNERSDPTPTPRGSVPSPPMSRGLATEEGAP